MKDFPFDVVKTNFLLNDLYLKQERDKAEAWHYSLLAILTITLLIMLIGPYKTGRNKRR